MKKPLIILTGPTAVGKTELSVKLAKALQGEIISADSIQVYKYMDIGSAKVTKEEMEGVKHYLIDELMPDEEFNIFYLRKRQRNMLMKFIRIIIFLLWQEEQAFIYSPFYMILNLKMKSLMTR